MTLNEREQAIVTGLAQGKVPKEISSDLGIDERYIRVLVTRLKTRLGYKTLGQMMWQLGRGK